MELILAWSSHKGGMNCAMSENSAFFKYPEKVPRKLQSIMGVGLFHFQDTVAVLHTGRMVIGGDGGEIFPFKILDFVPKICNNLEVRVISNKATPMNATNPPPWQM